MFSRYRWYVVAMLWWIVFFNYAARQAIFSVFPLLEKEVGLTPVQLGLLASSFAWVYGIGSPFAGLIVDRMRRMPTILGGLQAWSLICMTTAAARSFPSLLFFRAAEGMGETFYVPASVSLISDYHGKTIRSRALGIQQTSVYIRTIGGGFFAVWVGQSYGWRWSFIVFGGFDILLGAIFPMLGQAAIMARTDYLVNGPRDLMVFLTAAKARSGEGRPFIARTLDGGLHWGFVAWIAPDPGAGFTIMPSSVRLSPGRIVTAVRHEDSLRHGPNWIDAYSSNDNGQSWQYLRRPAPDTGDKSGNPPSLVGQRDGRLTITYGHRSPPLATVRNPGRLSSDGGRTWGKEILLRPAGGR